MLLLILMYTRHHATIFVAPAISEPLEALRRAWDPVMASQIAAHVTLVYPDEATDSDLLVERTQSACAVTTPFQLRLGACAVFGRPEHGVYVKVEDRDGGFGQMRQQIVRPPWQAIAFPPHVTLIHPRTSARGPVFWQHHSAWQPPQRIFEVREIAITAFNGTDWHSIERFPLQAKNC